MKNTKKCSKCLETKSVNLFYRDKRAKDGISYICKKCQIKATMSSPNRRRVVSEYQKRRRLRPECRAQLWFENTGRRDRGKGRIFLLTLEDVKRLFSQGCKYCGDKNIFHMSIVSFNIIHRK